MGLEIVGETRDMFIVKADPEVYGVAEFRCAKDPEKIPDGALRKITKKGDKITVVDATEELRKLVKKYMKEKEEQEG